MVCRSNTITRSTGAKISLWACVLVMTVASTAWGDPPPWAPAHGWRKKHDPNYAGYEGARWPSDYGILHGSCNREAIGAVLGGAVGGVVGSRVGQGETRAVATVLGAVIGAVIGAQIGKSMDEEIALAWAIVANSEISESHQSLTIERTKTPVFPAMRTISPNKVIPYAFSSPTGSPMYRRNLSPYIPIS